MTIERNIPARPTLYNGIQMRSRLEAGFAAWLDRYKFTWQYEPQTFATERGQYLPDFHIDELTILADTWPCELDIYVEVKPDALVDQATIAAQFGILNASLTTASPYRIHAIVVTELRTLYWAGPNSEVLFAECVWGFAIERPTLVPIVDQIAPLRGEYWTPTT